jgi:hypothetical protein
VIVVAPLGCPNPVVDEYICGDCTGREDADARGAGNEQELAFPGVAAPELGFLAEL